MNPLDVVRDLGEYLETDGPETEAEALAALAIVLQVCAKALGEVNNGCLLRNP